MTPSLLLQLFDLLSPRHCAGCGTRLAAVSDLLCPECLDHLPRTRYEQHPADNPMARRFWGLVPVERAAALYYYDPGSPLSRIVHLMKYHQRTDACIAMGMLMAGHLQAAGFFEGIDALVPVPLTPQRQRIRGYNQSLLLAEGMARVVPLPVEKGLLQRSNFDQSQTRRHAYARQMSVSQAFSLTSQDALPHRHLLLVDDVLTTGSTLLACATELVRLPGTTLSMATLGIGHM